MEKITIKVIYGDVEHCIYFDNESELSYKNICNKSYRLLLENNMYVKVVPTSIQRVNQITKQFETINFNTENLISSNMIAKNSINVTLQKTIQFEIPKGKKILDYFSSIADLFEKIQNSSKDECEFDFQINDYCATDEESFENAITKLVCLKHIVLS